MEPLDSIDLCRAFGMLTEKEVLAIRFLASIQPDTALCLNIGAGTGTSSLAFLEERPDLTNNFWTIDLNVETPFGGLQNERNAFDKYERKRPNQILHNSNTVSYPLYMNKVKPVFDYVFIDGDHSYDSVLADFENIYQYCGYGTIVAFHDYDNPDNNTKLVKKAVDEIVKRTESQPILHIDRLYAIMIKKLGMA